MDLSEVHQDPKHHADCCLAISRRLLDTLTSILLHAPRQVLSIGSGTGLLEDTLLRYSSGTINLIGVEVSPTVNKYLPESNLHVVNGTWAMYPDAHLAAAWVFVYPREPKLLNRYLSAQAHGALETIVWLGPRSDWSDFAPTLESRNAFHVTLVEDCGAAAYEMMAVATKIR